MVFVVSLNALLSDEIVSSDLKVGIGLKRLVGLAKPKVTLTKKVCKKLSCEKRKPKKCLRRK